jgi:hypothetical protein
VEAATDYITSMPRAEQDKRGRIRTFTGLYVNPLQLRDTDIRIEDIAHHLSHICRYTGACPEFYSVAQHSVSVARLMRLKYEKPEAEMAGLLHDAAEAYFNDIASPVKKDARMQWYRELEHEATLQIFEVFDLDPELLPLTKPADDAIFRREVASWWAPTTLAPQNIIRPWLPYVAEQSFLYKFNKLRSLR